MANPKKWPRRGAKGADKSPVSTAFASSAPFCGRFWSSLPKPKSERPEVRGFLKRLAGRTLLCPGTGTLRRQVRAGGVPTLVPLGPAAGRGLPALPMAGRGRAALPLVLTLNFDFLLSTFLSGLEGAAGNLKPTAPSLLTQLNLTSPGNHPREIIGPAHGETMR
jgi:hypothetical protein